jgi:glycosyltransferase involved in cell wall biosynthesis
MDEKKLVYLVTSNTSATVFGVPQIKHLDTSGFKIFLACGPGQLSSELDNMTYEIKQFKNLTRNISLIKDLQTLRKLIFWLNYIRPDVILYATPKAALLGSIAGRLCRIPIRVYQVWGVRWQNLSGIKLWVVRSADFIAIKLSTKLIVVSRSVLEFISTQFKTNKMIVLGLGSVPGVNKLIFYPGQPSPQLTVRRKIGYAGRISNEKGISELFDLFVKLISQIPNLHLEIIGDLDLEDKISKKLINDLNFHSNIQWIQGIQHDELAEHMRSWDAQIFLSRREGLGNVILEAGACGIPTFCWDIIGIRDAIPSFAQNFLIPFGDTNLLEKSVINYLDSPLNQNEKITLSNWYHENFEQKKVLSNLVESINDSLKVYNDSK